MDSDFVKNIVVSAATFRELSGLIDAFQARRHDAGFPGDCFIAGLERKTVILGVTGIGIANAASAATALTHLFSPDLLINTGCAGAYLGTGLEKGDLAVATSETFADLGAAAPDGWLSLEQMGLPLCDDERGPLYNEIPLPSPAVDMALTGSGRMGIPLVAGRFLTVSACSGTASRGRELRDRFGGICENMEGAAVALVAARYGVDCLEVRGISNLVEDRDLSRWDIPRAVAHAQRFIELLVRGL